jgi:hypothetical protein
MPAYWRLIAAALVLVPLTPPTLAAAVEDAVERGEYLIKAGAASPATRPRAANGSPEGGRS